MSASASQSSTRNSSPVPSRPSTNFLDNTAPMQVARTIFFKLMMKGSIAVFLVIFLVVSIYWGALWKLPAHQLPGWVVNFDNDAIGQAVTDGLIASSGFSKVSWSSIPASQFPDGPGHVAHDILNEKAWVAVIVHPGATAALKAAAASADASYNGSAAVTVYAVEARSENAYRVLIKPSVETALSTISRQFAVQFARESGSSASSLTSAAPQVLVNPVWYTIENLRPFDIPVAGALTFVGMIFMLILAFFLVGIGGGARAASGLETKLSTASLIRTRLGTVFTIYFVVSLFCSLLSKAFQVDFSRHFGPGGFVIFWMLNYCGMLALGLALESLVTVLTMRFVPFFLLFWIIANVSVTFMPLEVLPHIFRYGYGAPFYNMSQSTRTILFGTRNHLGRNFGVLLAWVATSVCTLSFFQWFVRRGAGEVKNDPEQGNTEIIEEITTESQDTEKMQEPSKQTTQQD